MMSTWGLLYCCLYFCMFEIFHNKMFFLSINALMWSLMESFDIKKGGGFFVESCSQYIIE